MVKMTSGKALMVLQLTTSCGRQGWEAGATEPSVLGQPSPEDPYLAISGAFGTKDLLDGCNGLARAIY